MDRTDDRTEELAERLRAAIGTLVRIGRGRADTLSPAHAATLGHLDREGPMTTADLARRRGVRHQGQSRTVIELEALGHVARTASATDARASVIGITEAGRLALTADRRARTSWMARAIDAELDPDERAALERMPELLARIAQHTDG
ncbi:MULTISPECIES: MarR family winged helix-turn-helix transcriptional regulator [unclassified Curtobacterium]|uniref:MarR family winged helix-turn-helix transcriptional regulator n=1 Tax=unclassified Curtobacterium TaxID=257496 RepID=UPI000DA9E1D9|nr:MULTISPECIES: MarR family transcriptional regulator [unclassified Curtobacterium]PZE27269.1 MarR family transcriptional regulator [Curtobacterium sp. MCBD17_028]PZF60213.1 MarR family transcriptional regulator [Curtobacterium sp. MCBD17_034]PZF61815.1 MarR family transcriptional regulator [Curtobacterium sp. MCBD17_013]PZM34898.1 MarR family transcriptional regulator [Curtobacterium sp. MCBD17_031]WIB63340.1 MarR family transcriptional regulator [Curtobacterium sp. MCBD17_040]